MAGISEVLTSFRFPSSNPWIQPKSMGPVPESNPSGQSQSHALFSSAWYVIHTRFNQVKDWLYLSTLRSPIPNQLKVFVLFHVVCAVFFNNTRPNSIDVSHNHVKLNRLDIFESEHEENVYWYGLFYRLCPDQYSSIIFTFCTTLNNKRKSLGVFSSVVITFNLLWDNSADDK